MRINSFINEHGKLIPVEVEISLWPGLPTLTFLGRADQHLKESAARIKSALKAQGFEFPKAKQILVNLRPSHLKKTSRGIELAVAAAYLWKTQQLPAPILSSDFYVYGELGLSGDVYQPDDLPKFFTENVSAVMTGSSRFEMRSEYTRHRIRSLAELSRPEMITGSSLGLAGFERPQLPRLWLPQSQARLLSLASIGGLHIFLAGASGSGKSTLADLIHKMAPMPTVESWKQICEQALNYGEEATFVPLVKPHHTTPTISMVGGGSVPMAGEITRAHRGVMVLDEFLEFRPQVVEALREPLEEGRIRVARAGKVQVFQAKFQCIATTNLCPCGDLSPETQGRKLCSYSLKRCSQYLEKLSGPILDRFHILHFTKKHSSEPRVSLESVFQQIEKTRNSGLEIQSVEIPEFWLSQLNENPLSERRKKHLISVMKNIARLDSKHVVDADVFQEAYGLAVEPFSKIRTLLC